MPLHDVLDRSVRTRGMHPAVIEGDCGRQIDYARLSFLSDRVRDRLAALGVVQGDRVGLYLRKSCDAIAAIFGILKVGAAYVPVDPTAPASRNAFIHNDCGVKAVILERQFEAVYRQQFALLGPLPATITLEGSGGGTHLAAILDALDADSPTFTTSTVDSAPDDLAYILYTSGSTGTPKGVMLSHRNALAFVDWSSGAFSPGPSDIFSSHAPFHFDLSIFDLYVSIKHGATLVLIPEDMGKEPPRLAQLISGRGITMWYSAPSALTLLAQFGRLSDHDFSKLRMVLFAGEVFPVVHLRSLQRQVPHPRYFNLYGPTETNVCTWYEIPATIPNDRLDPYPIGKTCANLESVVVDHEGVPVPPGTEGELCIAGPNVMQGYWGQPEQTAGSFLLDTKASKRWYKTGDIVRIEPDGNFRYIGRRDRLVKKRGYRIELGEIEACLYRHPSVREAAVVALPNADLGVAIKAHLGVHGERRLSLIELKTFCSQHLPVYMVPDTIEFHDCIPKTSTGKVDYVALTHLG